MNDYEVIPIVLLSWPEQPLFIILGKIEETPPTIYGNAYIYTTFPWREEFKPSYEACKEAGEFNFNNHLWLSDDLLEQVMNM